MIGCAQCNSRLASDDNFCPHCGTSMAGQLAITPPPTTAQIDRINLKREPESMRQRAGLLLIVSMAGVLLASAIIQHLRPHHGWTNVITRDGTYQVSFPAQVSDQSHNAITQYASVDVHGDHYLAQFVHTGQSVTNDQAYAYLDTFIKTLAQQGLASVLVNKPVLHLGKPGVEATLFNAPGQRYTVAWLTFMNDTSIFLGIESGDKIPQNYDQFIASLTIL